MGFVFTVTLALYSPLEPVPKPHPKPAIVRPAFEQAIQNAIVNPQVLDITGEPK